MASTFNWIFGKKKSSPPSSRVEEKEVEDGYLLVNDSNIPEESKANLYPIINQEGSDPQPEAGSSSELQTMHDNVQCESAYFISGVPFKIATPVVSDNDIAQVQHFLYLTKRTTNLNNYSYDFALELSVVNQ